MQNILCFIEAHINGKTLHTKELQYDLEDGALQGIYADQISFSNLKHSSSGFQLDMFIVSNEKIWEMKHGNKDTLRKDFSAVSLFRFELAKRKSTGALIGFFRFLSASGKEVAAEAIVSAIYDVKLVGDVLSFQEDQVLYRDQPIAGEAYKPIALQSTHRFFVLEEKLHYEYDGQSFDVNPVSLVRKTSTDHFPPFVSIEK
ncbi:MAG: hypothetical protein ACOX3W_03780 [Christensenellaceae bacterium]|jgi:hypothetical protein